jgi:hypothetical protein
MNGTDITMERYFEPAATVHVTTGSGGNPEMIHKGTLPPPRGACHNSSPWCAFQSGYYPRDGHTADFTYSRITIHNVTTLEWEQRSALSGTASDSQRTCVCLLFIIMFSLTLIEALTCLYWRSSSPEALTRFYYFTSVHRAPKHSHGEH